MNRNSTQQQLTTLALAFDSLPEYRKNLLNIDHKFCTRSQGRVLIFVKISNLG